ncbi:MAG TPA: hypothetical protein VMT46_05500 [Anaerolineaceae bacterium]|nr:hypothetical protein [Anaerolineaceae bacterium]
MEEINPIVSAMDQIANLEKGLIDRYIPRPTMGPEDTQKMVNTMLADIIGSLISLGVMRKMNRQKAI